MPGLSTFGIARKNIQWRPWRSFCLIMVILLFSFFLFAGSVLSMSLSRGAESTANRLGADIMLVPEGFDPNVDSILLSGKPSNFYLPADAMEPVKKLAADIGELNSESKNCKAASLVVKSDDGKRSFKVEIAPPEGLSYAKDIAEKYGVTYEMLTSE